MKSHYRAAAAVGDGAVVAARGDERESPEEQERVTQHAGQRNASRPHWGGG